jgi:hypothetical protein
MTGSISYRLVDLVWINRMQNKLNEKIKIVPGRRIQII